MANNVIDSFSFNNNKYTFTLPYGSCSTAAGTAAKTVSVSNFVLETGARILVKFTITNTASNPTLNVNSTGAKAIMYRGSAISAGYLAANRVYEFIYNGTNWEFVGDINTDTWKANTASSEGYVKSGSGKANKVWKTDASGNPDWRDDADTNTWKANTATSEGYVAKGEGYANKVWKTDGNGVPGWRDDADTNTHYTSKNVVGSSTATSNTTSALANGNVYLNHIENGSKTSSHKITGSGATTVTTDTSGNIIINSTNTTYGTVTGSADGLVPKCDGVDGDGILSSKNDRVFSCDDGLGTIGWHKLPETAFSDTTYSNATTSASGLMSTSDKKKLDGIASGAEVNQNAFSNITVGSTTIAADAKTDTLTLAGSNVTITPDATNDKVTIGITKANVTTALGYTPPTTNTTYSNATASTAGLVKVSSVNSSAVSVNSESTTAGRYYPVELNKDGKAIVNVPWIDVNTKGALVYYGTCSTSTSTDKKVVNIINGTYTLATGSIVIVNFKESVRLNAELNVAGTGSKKIFINSYGNVSMASRMFHPSQTAIFVYDATLNGYLFLGAQSPSIQKETFTATPNGSGIVALKIDSGLSTETGISPLYHQVLSVCAEKDNAICLCTTGINTSGNWIAKITNSSGSAITSSVDITFTFIRMQ